MLIKKDNLSSKGSGIYKNLREQISYGTLNPGEKIVESKISKDFDVSRIPIREAIKQLEAEGLCEYCPQQRNMRKKDIVEGR